MSSLLEGKSPELAALVGQLDYERRGWVLVDHWVSDADAIALAHPRDLRRLVYLCHYEDEPDSCYYECEIPDGPKPEQYAVPARGTASGLAALLDVLEGHLAAR